jgi:uncharacterized repeat protein (TIGR03803 family)
VPGTVFEISRTGEVKTIYSFCSQPNCADGFYPAGGLIQVVVNPSQREVWLYGTTGASGTGPGGSGTVFKISSEGQLETLYTFCAQSGCADGSSPFGTLTQATDGNLYGTTFSGSVFASICNAFLGCGTVFEITPGGALTTLYSFCYVQSTCAEGANPRAGLVQDTNGFLFGTTQYGGTDDLGTAFSLGIGQAAFVKTVPGAATAGYTVKILGTFPMGATSVSFNGTTATFTNVTAYELSATVPTGAISGTVTVVTPRGTLSSYPPFQVLP